MTREEFINWFEERFVLTKNDIYEFGQLYDEVTKPRWISVEDELPIDYEPVLAVVGGNHFAFVGICLNKKTWYCEIQNKATEIIGITHWMPLPQPPKKGGDQ